MQTNHFLFENLKNTESAQLFSWRVRTTGPAAVRVCERVVSLRLLIVSRLMHRSLAFNAN